MQIKKRHILSINHSKASSSRHSSSDFTSILNESPWERFVDKTKPLVKILLVVAIIGGSIYGGTLLFGNKDSGTQSTEYASNNTDHQSDDKEKLHQCLEDVVKANPSPETSDPEFYKKLIDGYDKRLGCYEKYPGIDLAGKSQVEENRKSAIDSSGTYKDTYLASGGSYDYTTSSNHVNPTTGCSYTLSESEYIKCTDNYNSKNGTSVSRTPPPTATSPAPVSPEPSAPGYVHTPSNPSSGNSPSNGGYDRSYWQRVCETQVRQSSGGTGLVQSQRDKAVARCMHEHGY